MKSKLAMSHTKTRSNKCSENISHLVIYIRMDFHLFCFGDKRIGHMESDGRTLLVLLRTMFNIRCWCVVTHTSLGCFGAFIKGRSWNTEIILQRQKFHIYFTVVRIIVIDRFVVRFITTCMATLDSWFIREGRRNVLAKLLINHSLAVDTFRLMTVHSTLSLCTLCTELHAWFIS